MINQRSQKVTKGLFQKPRYIFRLNFMKKHDLLDQIRPFSCYGEVERFLKTFRFCYNLDFCPCLFVIYRQAHIFNTIANMKITTCVFLLFMFKEFKIPKFLCFRLPKDMSTKICDYLKDITYFCTFIFSLSLSNQERREIA